MQGDIDAEDRKDNCKRELQWLQLSPSDITAEIK